jgi:hypothetical protein
MKRNTFVLSVALMVSMCSGTSRAQYGFGYPGGYGGCGWGGWGTGTVGGSLARGMGMFGMGRGIYNLDSAQARSINANTVTRFNQYVFQSQMNTNRRYHQRLAAQRKQINQAYDEIQDRLRNHPSDLDINDGDALNVLLETLLNPATADRSLQYIKTPLRSDIIANIPFEVATEGMTACLDSMTMDGQWPLALRDDTFAQERQALRSAVQNALKEDEQGNLDPETIVAVGTAVKNLKLKFDKLVPETNPDYMPARDAIKAMAGLTKMLYSPQMEKILAELDDYQGTTLGDMLAFMQAFNLRFAPASSYKQRMIYTKLYPMLAEQANGSLGSGAGGGVEAAASQAVGAAEGVGTKAIDGLKSAATDFFKGMGWEHLFGK